MRLKLKRIERTDFATYGQLLDEENKLLCVTLEKPYVDANGDGVTDRSVSCIPAGEFPVHRRLSPKRGYELFELEQVPGRSNIEIHRGNLPSDSEGCILVGSEFGDFGGKKAVIASKDAFTKFMTAMHGVDRFTLTVIDP